jgi:nucleoside-diphosphate-sugar epimerase
LRIFLTGGTGYIGSRLAQRLAGDGHDLHCLIRATSDAAALARLGAHLHTGDIRDRVSMREGMAGADAVIHAAAELDLQTPAERMDAVNVQGSENVASLAYKLGVGRLLAISSIATFGGSPADAPATEESPLYLPPTRYGATKRAGQQAIAGWAQRGLRVNTVYPSLVYGPPGKRGGANGLLRALARRRFPVLVAPRRRSCWIHLDDLVDGIVRLLERADPGRDYLMTGDVATVREIAAQVSEVTGVRPPRFGLPVWTIRAAAALFPSLLPRHLAREQLRSLARDWVFDDTRARQELDWHPRSLAEGIPPTVRFLLRE